MRNENEVIEPTRRNWISYAGLLSMSALNAFNDNFARFTLVPLGTWLVSTGMGFTGIQHVLALMMVLPFILLAPTSGWLADRFSKSRVLYWAAWMQLAVLAMMAAALWLHSLVLALLAFFLLAVQSTLMSPAKSGLMKELLGSKRLALGSGLMDGVLILAILGGQVFSGLFFDSRLRSSNDGWQAAMGPVVALGGSCLLALLSVMAIERSRSRSSRPFTAGIALGHVRDFSSLWRRKPLRLSALGSAFFWGFGGLLNLIIIEAAEIRFDGGEGTGSAISLMMGLASVGIALGSIITGWLSRRGTELGLIPVGGLLMVLGTLLLAFSGGSGAGLWGGLFVTGCGAATFYVPLRAFLVDQCPEDERGKLLGVSNLLSNLFGISAVIAQFVMKAIGLPVAWQFGLMAVLAIWATGFVTKLLPQHFLKFVGLSLIRSIYRIRVRGAEKIPEEGGVILCPNHISFVDALVISAASPRPVRFLMAEQCFRRKWIGNIARVFNAVPVSPTRAKEAIRIAADEVAAGNVVCIFPEGQLTRSGAPVEIKRGFLMIARKSKCPVVPAHMHGLWGSLASFSGGRYFKKWPRKLAAGIQVAFGDPIPPDEVSVEQIKEVWRKSAEESVSRERIAQTAFSDPATLLTDEPEDWRQAVREMRALPVEEFDKLVAEARMLASVAFWNRGDRVLLQWEADERLSRVLGVLLHPLVGVKVVLVPRSASEAEMLREAREHVVDRVVVKRGALSEERWGEWMPYKPMVIGDWQGGEKELFQEGVFPALEGGGKLLTWSMPHPEDPNPLALFQPGWKEGSAGRLLPTVSPDQVASWQSDSEGFLFPREERGSPEAKESSKRG